jgi:hypothetical protein
MFGIKHFPNFPGVSFSQRAVRMSQCNDDQCYCRTQMNSAAMRFSSSAFWCQLDSRQASLTTTQSMI